MDCAEQYERVCRVQFERIIAKLERIDEALRGNGGPGIKVRLDRLERSEQTRRRMVWALVGATVTMAGAVVRSLF